MFCPSCGAADQMPPAYCRKCGEWLVDPKKAISRISQAPEQRIQLMTVFSAVNAVLAAVSAIALYATHTGKPTDWSEVLALASLTVVTMHQTISFLFAMGLVQRFDRNRKNAASKPESELITSKLSIVTDDSHRLGSPPSLVEDTTKLLETDQKRKRPLSEGG